MLLTNKGRRGAVESQLDKLKLACSAGLSPIPDSKLFVFLCGANEAPGKPSARRKAILSFAKQHLTHCQFFLAEPLFEELTRIGGTKHNLLDVENQISGFADKIIIILESPSAFCELGAFSAGELREKVIVINDLAYIKEESFINHGPLAAIHNKSGASNVIFYAMDPSTGATQQDGIASIFKSLEKVLPPTAKSRRTRVSAEDLTPVDFKSLTKERLKFVHDLISLSGPIGHSELVELCIAIFGQKDYKALGHYTALLKALGLISRDSTGQYSSTSYNLYYNYPYPFDADAYRSAIRALYWRINRRGFIK
jgi:hypothetical protein